MPKYRLKWVSDATPDGVWEDYNDDTVIDRSTAENAARRMLEDYNAVEIERYGDGPKVQRRLRRLVGVDFGGGAARRSHDYQKANAVTLGGAHGLRDKWICTKCGCVALRYGVSSGFKRTGRWRAKKYEFCKE